MFLKDVGAGKRFMFEDRSTPLALASPAKGQMAAGGTWVHVRTGEYGCPVIRSEFVDKEVTLVSSTYLRSVLILI